MKLWFLGAPVEVKGSADDGWVWGEWVDEKGRPKVAWFWLAQCKATPWGRW